MDDFFNEGPGRNPGGAHVENVRFQANDRRCAAMAAGDAGWEAAACDELKPFICQRCVSHACLHARICSSMRRCSRIYTHG